MILLGNRCTIEPTQYFRNRIYIWERVKDSKLLSVEEEWELFKSTVLRCAAVVCGYKNVGRKREVHGGMRR